HGKGRIWRLRWRSAPADDGLRPSQVAKRPTRELRDLLSDPRRPIRDAAGEALAHRGAEGKQILAGVFQNGADTRARTQALWAGLRLEGQDARTLLRAGLADLAPEVRGEAAHWLGRLGAEPNG